MSAVVLSIALVISLIGTLLNVVKEREMKMFDLLQISGEFLCISFSYFLSNFFLVQLCMYFKTRNRTYYNCLLHIEHRNEHFVWQSHDGYTYWNV